MIKNIDKAACGLLRAEMTAAMTAIADKHGIKINLGGMKFDGKSMHCKLEAAVISTTGVAETKEAQSYRMYALTFGLKPEWLGQEFTIQGGRYRVVGLNTRAHRMPVIAENVVTHKMHKMSPGLLVKGFAARPVPTTPAFVPVKAPAGSYEAQY